MKISLNYLIDEGYNIKNGIREVPNSYFTEYRVEDNLQYENWRKTTLRFLIASFNKDRCIKDFEDANKKFVEKLYDPNCFDEILAILNACSIVPTLPVVDSPNYLPTNNPINVSITQNQHQSQTQEQSLVIDLFLEAIKDEITGKQLKELKSIVQEEPNPEKAKSRILDKVKSWGESISASIVANIITNPTIWAGLM